MANQEDIFRYALSSNNAWAGYKAHQNPQFFPKLASGQSPQILWLGCSDSRCPETTILGLQPGDVFVHRNVANIVLPTDVSTAAAVEFAVSVLRVRHVVLCGHSACGGAAAALKSADDGDATCGSGNGVLDLWLAPLRALRAEHDAELRAIADGAERCARLAERNVEAGVRVLMANGLVARAVGERGLQVHGCMFDVGSGRIRDLGFGTGGKAGDGSEGEGMVRGNHGVLVFKGGGGGASMAVR